jgi:glycerol-3-phosphate dehydrogenase
VNSRLPLPLPPLANEPVACDVLVVGGGINGAGIARDLAGRGASVLLVEKDDLASHTSSSSTKLIHGGLRYLEYGEFALVRKALAERERLLKSAPHIMWPLRFVMPHDPSSKSVRPVWMIRAGLFLYDHLAHRELLLASRTVNLREHPAGAPLHKRFRRGFVYSDGWVDDARLVVLNAIDAAEHGATVLTRCACVDAKRSAAHWQATLRHDDGTTHNVQARALVNATGPWAAQFLAEHAHAPRSQQLRLVKGSHIVVRKRFDHDHAYIFQNPDKRIIFVIPYEGEFTLIGTTEVEHQGAIGAARIDNNEIAYLCEQASRYLARAVVPADVVWSYSGVRPLLDDESGDPSAVTRDYSLELDWPAAGPPQGGRAPVGGRGEAPRGHGRQAPLLNVWGGKITTFRKLAEEAADLLAAPLALPRGPWTGNALLPGGDLSAWIGAPKRPDDDFERFVHALLVRQPQLHPKLARRLARAYGGRVNMVLNDGGAEVAPGLFETELRYLHDHEWARSADDVLWRRSKLGLHMNDAERAAVAAWCGAHWAATASAAEHKLTTEAAWS